MPQISMTAPGLQALSDEEVVRRVVAGEVGLFELLMRRHNQRVYRVARSIVKDESEAEDIMQETYVRAFGHLAQYQGLAPFSTWLTKIAVYEALARNRRSARVVQFRTDQEGEELSVDNLESPERSPEDGASQGELSSLLSKVLDVLPEAQRLVFVLREVEGLSTAETASCLEVGEDSVKVRLHRARAALRKAIDSQIGAESRQLFSFHLSRCDRVVSLVMERLLTSFPHI